MWAKNISWGLVSVNVKMDRNRIKCGNSHTAKKMRITLSAAFLLWGSELIAVKEVNVLPLAHASLHSLWVWVSSTLEDKQPLEMP